MKLGVKPKTITNRWCDLKKKLFANDGAGPDADLSAPGPAARGKRKVDGAQDGPALKKKAAKSRAAKKKSATEFDEDTGFDANDEHSDI